MVIGCPLSYHLWMVEKMMVRVNTGIEYNDKTLRGLIRNASHVITEIEQIVLVSDYVALHGGKK